MLVTADLHAHYGASHIVQGVDLAVGAGEVVGVFGRNGVGKTTSPAPTARSMPCTMWLAP